MTRGSLIDVAHSHLQLSLITALAAAYQLMLYANFCRQIKYELPDSSYLITWHAPTVTSPLVKVLRFYKAKA